MTPFDEPLHPLLQTANGATPEQLRRQAFVESLASGVMAALLIALACTLFLRSAPFQYMMTALRSTLAGGAAGAGFRPWHSLRTPLPPCEDDQLAQRVTASPSLCFDGLKVRLAGSATNGS